MGKIVNFIKRYWVLILVALAVVLILIDRIITPKTPTPPVTSTPTSTRIAEYKSIKLGKSTLDEINKLLGFPVGQSEEGGKITAEYKSSSKYRNNIVIVQNGVATLIKEIVTATDNKKSQDITNEFGVAPYRLYSQELSATFDLYVYPANGIAYLGHEDGTLLEIWYFQPTDIDNFTTTWANGYSTEKSNKIPQY